MFSIMSPSVCLPLVYFPSQINQALSLRNREPENGPAIYRLKAESFSGHNVLSAITEYKPDHGSAPTSQNYKNMLTMYSHQYSKISSGQK